MKKRTVLITILLCAALLTACGAPAKTPTAESASSSENSKVRDAVPQGKTDFLGGWEDASDAHAQMSVVPTQSGGDYAVQIRMGADVVWTMNAVFHEETGILEYENGSKSAQTRGEDGSIASATPPAESSSGTFRVNKNGELEWTDSLEEQAASCRFTRTYSETPTTEDLRENFFLPVGKIGQGSAGSSLRNASTACEIISYAHSRDLWNADAEQLQTALRAAWDALSEEERTAFGANYSEMTLLVNATLKNLESRIGYYEDAGVGETIRELMQNDFARFSWATLFANQMTMSLPG